MSTRVLTGTHIFITIIVEALKLEERAVALDNSIILYALNSISWIPSKFRIEVQRNLNSEKSWIATT